MYKLGFIPDPNAHLYPAFDSNVHIKAGLSLSSDDPDLRQYALKIYNQGNTSCCVGFSSKQALQVKHCIEHGTNNFVEFSALDIYYGARSLTDPPTTNQDEGTFISLAAESIKRFGVCRDLMWPFDETHLFIPPSVMADREESMNKIEGHFRIATSGRDRVNDIITNLKLNNPVILGTTVDMSMWSAFSSASAPLDTPKTVSGSHCICILGYETETDCFYFANSWGGAWGISGFGKIKADIIGNPSLTQDVWILVHSSDAWFERKVS